MSERLYDYLEITDLKDMLNKTKNLYGEKIAYKIRNDEGKYKLITHKEVRDMIDSLGTELIDLGLKGKRIAIIGPNRYEWEIAYLAIVCGTGIAVPLDKSLPENELESLIERAEVEAIFYTEKYEESLIKIRNNQKNKLKYLISMDLKQNTTNIISEEALIEKGKKLLEGKNTEFINAQINSEEMSVMLFTSGTTSKSKVVKLSHKNICANIMDLGSVLDVNSEDILLSILPIHHVFECTVGFLFSLYKGAQTVFCDGLRHIVENLNEYNVSTMACVPSVYEKIFSIIMKKLEKQGKLQDVLGKMEKYKDATMEEKKQVFKEIHDMLGGNIKLFISGAAALDKKIEEKYRLLGINIVQGYGLTETSPVVGIGTNKYHRAGSIGKSLPSVEARISNKNSEGIGELIVKGPSVMLGYYDNEIATNEVIKDGWFYTGDLAKIDDDGYIYICGRKKSVIVLKNGKNIFPEEIENLVNKIDGVKESFVFGKVKSEDKNDIKINVQLVIDKEEIEEIYKTQNNDEIHKILSGKIKEINKIMPRYKSIKGILITENELIKTTTNKIKRQANLDAIEKLKN